MTAVVLVARIVMVVVLVRMVRDGGLHVGKMMTKINAVGCYGDSDGEKLVIEMMARVVVIVVVVVWCWRWWV